MLDASVPHNNEVVDVPHLRFWAGRGLTCQIACDRSTGIHHTTHWGYSDGVSMRPSIPPAAYHVSSLSSAWYIRKSWWDFRITSIMTVCVVLEMNHQQRFHLVPTLQPFAHMRTRNHRHGAWTSTSITRRSSARCPQTKQLVTQDTIYIIYHKVPTPTKHTRPQAAILIIHHQNIHHPPDTQSTRPKRTAHDRQPECLQTRSPLPRSPHQYPRLTPVTPPPAAPKTRLTTTTYMRKEPRERRATSNSGKRTPSTTITPADGEQIERVAVLVIRIRFRRRRKEATRMHEGRVDQQGVWNVSWNMGLVEYCSTQLSATGVAVGVSLQLRGDCWGWSEVATESL